MKSGQRDRRSLLRLLADKEFWEPHGRLGVITKGDYSNRLILFYPEHTSGYWTEVVSSSPEDGPLDSYIVADYYAANVFWEYQVVWLARGNEETALEELIFGWRQELHPPRPTLRQSAQELMHQIRGK